jgi:hypothetical protein
MPHKCHGNAQNCPSRYCIPTCTLYRYTYSLTYQMPHKCHRNTPAGTAYLLVQCTDMPTLSPTRCRTSVTAMRIPTCTVHCTVYSLLPHLPNAANSTAMRKIAPAGTTYTYSTCVQTSLLPHLPDVTKSVTAMHRIAPEGTEHLPVQCTDISAPSSTRCHTSVTEIPQQVLPTYLYGVQTSLLPNLLNTANSVTEMSKIVPAGTAYLLVQCTVYIPYSLSYQMPQKCHGNAQNCPSRYCLLILPVQYIYNTCIPAPSSTRCHTSVTVMRRIVISGLYTYFRPSRSPTRCSTNAQNYPSRYCEPICIAPPFTRTRTRDHSAPNCHWSQQLCTFTGKIYIPTYSTWYCEPVRLTGTALVQCTLYNVHTGPVSMGYGDMRCGDIHTFMV